MRAAVHALQLTLIQSCWVPFQLQKADALSCIMTHEADGPEGKQACTTAHIHGNMSGVLALPKDTVITLHHDA